MFYIFISSVKERKKKISSKRSRGVVTDTESKEKDKNPKLERNGRMGVDHHRRDEAHPGDGDYKDPEEPNEEDEDKPECDYGVDCYRKNPQHRRDFKHTKRPQRKRAAKAEKKRKKKTEDDYDSDDSFIDDEEDGWEPVDDSDEDADFESPADMSSDLE